MDLKILLTAVCSTVAPTIHAQPASVFVKDIVYATVNDIDLLLDMAKPASDNGPRPAILYFHGGGWQAGDKSHAHDKLVSLAEAGYVAVSVGYRFAPQYKWPDQVFDAKAAVRFLREHAGEYDIDPNHIGAAGESAGGYLALMLAFTDDEDGLEGYGAKEISSHVQAVVSFCSAGDFTRTSHRVLPPELERQIAGYYKKPLSQVLAEFTGTTDPNDPKLTRMSAKTYVDAGDPPALIFQGEVDPLISMDQVNELHAALQKADVHSEVVVVKGEGHGWHGEALKKSVKEMINFFDQYLKVKN